MQLYKLTCFLLQSISKDEKRERSLIAFCFLIPIWFLNSKSEIYNITTLYNIEVYFFLNKLHYKDYIYILISLNYKLNRFNINLEKFIL